MNTTSPKYKIGQTIGHYLIKNIVEIKELQSIFYELEHTKMKSTILHVANEDPENLFCLAFQTPPSSSNGLPHILEHTVLCGSKKYPIKDPFFGMTKRSLNTFMNALTGSDFTCYPAASLIEKDFYNLLEVYIDSTFFPLLKELSFLQEGCRTEFLEQENKDSPLVFKGIVYNEMKGCLGSIDSRLSHYINETLMPDLPYKYNSGGDPKEIPLLTYKEFLNFYEKHYHPSSCLFYFYGNLPLEKHLEFLENQLFKEVTPKERKISFPVQKRFLCPLKEKRFYPTHEKKGKNKTWVSFSWLTAQIKDQEEILALTLLDSMLLDTDASILKHALMESDLCTQVEAYIDPEMSEMPFHIICKGCEEKDVDALEQVIFKTLKECFEKGFEEEQIRSSLHQLEFSGTEITSDHYPFGLILFFKAGLAKLHGCDPASQLLLHTHFEKLIELTEDPKYLPSLIDKYLLNNRHFVRIVLSPDEHLEEKEHEREKKLLESIKAKLSEAEKTKVIENASILKSYQEKVETKELECLPKLKIEEIPKKTTFFELNKRSLPSLEIYHHPNFTNHIVYADLVCSLPHLTKEELYYTKLFTLLFSEVGTKNRTYKENLEKLYKFTGGVSCALGIHSQCNTPEIIKPAIHLRGKALSRNKAMLFSLMSEMMQSVSFKEKPRIKELILQIHQELSEKILKGSISYATDLAVFENSIPTKLHHIWHGFGFYEFIKSLAQEIDHKLPMIMDHLTHLKPKLFHHQHMDLILSCSQKDFENIEKENFYGLSNLDKYPYHPWVSDFDIHSIGSHARIISSGVAFICRAAKTIYAPNPDSPFLSLSSTIMQNEILLKKVREQGGAYGSGASYNIINGNFSMYSYRDPNIASTFDAFDAAIEMISEGDFSTEQLEQAKFNIIQHIDSPVSPGLKATDSYSQIRENLRLDLRQAFRDKTLAATKEQVSNATAKHLSNIAKEAKAAVFCSERLLKKEEGKLKEKLKVLPL